MSGIASRPKDVDAIVVGAGIAGLYQVYRLRELGFSVLGLESASDVGGTWYWNCYPGARVDSQSYVYQYWFSDELIEEWDWQERFPAQPETERYLRFVTDKLDLRKEFEFETRVTSGTWNEDEGCWTVTTDSDHVFRARFLVSCTGMLSAPKIPRFPHDEEFRGTIVHTARYPREGIDLAGKRVGVIGCGATGIQVIQTIAPEVAELTVFQRKPSYAVPMRNEKFDDAQRDHWRAKAPELRKRVFETLTGFDFDFENGSWYDATPEERREVLEGVWNDGSLAIWVGTYPEVFFDEAANEELSDWVRAKIRARIDDPKVAELLTPQNVGFGTYRVPLESGFYEQFNRPNVELVDLYTTPIERFTPSGIQLSDGREIGLDLVILATGFDAGTGSLTRMDIHGRDGRALTEEWGREIRSTLGLQVHGYPNLFTIGGPLAPAAAFCNMTTCLQQQVDWVSDCIAYLREHDRRTIEPSLEKQNEWVAHHDEVTQGTLVVKTHSWYTGANIEGKPSKRLLSYLGAGTYKQACDEVKESGYAGFVLG
jgi:acetone monooxygenase